VPIQWRERGDGVGLFRDGALRRPDISTPLDRARDKNLGPINCGARGEWLEVGTMPWSASGEGDYPASDIERTGDKYRVRWRTSPDEVTIAEQNVLTGKGRKPEKGEHQ
jgi:hypothetical protein